MSGDDRNKRHHVHRAGFPPRHILEHQNNIGRERSAIGGDVSEFDHDVPARTVAGPSPQHGLGHELVHEDRTSRWQLIPAAHMVLKHHCWT